MKGFKVLAGFIFLCTFFVSSSEERLIVGHIKGAQYIRHSDYVLEYSEDHEQAYYVAYILTAKELEGSAQRKSHFKQDPLVKTESANHDDYTNSGFDRGHLAPAADMAENEQDMEESFYMSNVSPQRPSFNRGIWKKLEEEVRTWALENGRVIVVTGPVLRGDMDGAIGENQVSVPRYFYKVVLDIDKPSIKAIGFVLPNKKSSRSLEVYAMSVDRVEKITGMDFFPFLPDKLENRIEASADYRQW